MSTVNLKVLGEVAAERVKQDAKWGEQNHPDGTGSIIDRFTASAVRRQTERAAVADELTWRNVLAEEVYEAFAEDDQTKLRAELVQVAAVAAAWIECIDRRAS